MSTLSDLTFNELRALLDTEFTGDANNRRALWAEIDGRCIALAERTPATPHIPHDDPYHNAPKRPDCYYPEPLCYLLPGQCCRRKAATTEPA